jgi:polycomb protein EED
VQHIQHPVFVTSDVHEEYVDDVAWVGELLLSKSVTGEMVLWRPHADIFRLCALGVMQAPLDSVAILRRFTYPHADVWFVHFGLHLQAGLVAIGNKVGTMYVWNLGLQPGLAEREGCVVRPATAARRGDCTGGAQVQVRCITMLSCSAIVAGLDDGRIVLMRA